MDSRHGLEIGSAFSSEVNTGVPVEIVEAENQTVEAVLSNEGNSQNVSREEEAMDIGVDSGSMDNSQLASSIGVGPTGLSGIEPTQMNNAITSQLSAGVGQSQLMVPSSQLSSIGVDTTHISSQMGMGAIRIHENVDQQLPSVSSSQQFQQVNQALAAQALEISPESISFPSSQSTLASNIMHPHSSEGDGNDAIPSNMLERAKEILGNVNYADLDISRAINSTVDPNLTVSSSMATTSGMDTTNILNDPEVPSSPESNFDSSDLLNSAIMQQDEVTARLAQAGPIGVAAAAAVMSGRKRKRTHTFESNPALRKRHCSKLVRKLKDTIEELTARVGLQAVVVMYKPGKLEPKEEPSFKVFGATPLINVVRNQREAIVTDMELSLQEQAPPPKSQEAALHELPPLVFEGIPTPVHKMTQAQLRAFIPNMLKFSTGRGKPGWAKNDMKPQWWPVEVPWQNVRSDSRQEHNKKDLSWTDALRRIVISCYVHHGRIDLLPEFSAEHLQQALTPEAAQQLQLQLDRLQQQGDFQTFSATSQSEEGVSTLGEVSSNQTQSDNQQVFTVDTGMGNCDTSGMPTLVDASLAETAAKLQQVCDHFVPRLSSSSWYLFMVGGISSLNFKGNLGIGWFQYMYMYSIQTHSCCTHGMIQNNS